MTNRLSIVLAALAAATVFATGACDDSTDEGSGGSTSTSGTTSTGTGGAGGSGIDCEAVCTELFACALEDNGGEPYCPDWTQSQEDQYLNGCMDLTECPSPGCIAQCTALPALDALVNPNDCGTTIATLKAANPTMKTKCENGFDSPCPTECATGGAGGAGGAGGSGG
jgi:hypothetical protein